MKKKIITGLILAPLIIPSAYAAIALDRTRVVFDGAQKSISLSVSNENKQLPYLAQAWIEDEKGNKISTPLAVLPPVQRMEPGSHSQVKIQSVGAETALPQNRETVFYFNLREIPPRSEKANTLQIALQTRVKLFYRPAALFVKSDSTPWQEKITLTRQGERYQVNNPTPYYVTLVDGRNSVKSQTARDFDAVMVDPNGNAMLSSGISTLGNSPVLTYINDYGGRMQLQFSCSGTTCQASPIKK